MCCAGCCAAPCATAACSGMDRPFLGEIAEVVLDTDGRVPPEILARREFILRTIHHRGRELPAARSTRGLEPLRAVTAGAEPRASVPGGEAFRLYDTFGLPRDLIDELARERGLEGDWPGYEEACRQQQRQPGRAARSRRGKAQRQEVYQQISPEPTEFLGYDYGSSERRPAHVLGLVRRAAPRQAGRRAGGRGRSSTARLSTREGGGQVGDSGVLEWEGGSATVRDTSKPVGGVFVHYGAVDARHLAHRAAGRRRPCRRARAGTPCATTPPPTCCTKPCATCWARMCSRPGQLVAPDRLRFDFSHNAADQPAKI